MNDSFSVTDLLEPVIKRFNTSVRSFLNVVEKHIGYDGPHEFTLTPGESKQVNFDHSVPSGRIGHVLYSYWDKDFDPGSFRGGFKIKPHWNGSFDLVFLNKQHEEIETIEGVSQLAFFSGAGIVKDIRALKTFWQELIGRKVLA